MAGMAGGQVQQQGQQLTADERPNMVISTNNNIVELDTLVLAELVQSFLSFVAIHIVVVCCL